MSSIEEGTSASSAQGRLYQPYDQFLLFGDSITEFSCNQSMGFAFHPALQDCMFSAPLDLLYGYPQQPKKKQDMLTSGSLYTPTGCNKPRFQVRAARPSSYESLESHRLNAHTMQWLYICKCPPGAPKLLPDSPDIEGPANGMYTTWYPSHTQKRGKGDELTNKDHLLRRQ